VNPAYTGPYVFDNDFPALHSQSASEEITVGHLLRAQTESGRCRVICYSPLHHLTLAQMPVPGIREVIETWTAEYASLGADPNIRAVTIFENRGAMMGASNPHPHGQIWANQTVPGELLKESDGQLQYRRHRGSCLLCDYATLELERRERVICSNEHFVSVVPF
jgi:UDPglucose--hexose-1-phosphate uridylyltransferase